MQVHTWVHKINVPTGKLEKKNEADKQEQPTSLLKGYDHDRLNEAKPCR